MSRYLENWSREYQRLQTESGQPQHDQTSKSASLIKKVAQLRRSLFSRRRYLVTGASDRAGMLECMDALTISK